MPKKPTPEITVTPVFEGTQTGEQAFIHLIALNAKLDNSKYYIDNNQYIHYSGDRENSLSVRSCKGESV